MKYYIVNYITRDGEREYTEEGVMQAEENEIEVKAEEGKIIFTRFGWEEFCEQAGWQEIPETDYQILVKYITNIDKALEAEKRLKNGVFPDDY